MRGEKREHAAVVLGDRQTLLARHNSSQAL